MTLASKNFSVQIVSLEDIAVDVRIVRFSIQGNTNAAFSFQPGQYLRLSAPGYEARYFSIASTPDQPLIELHVRNAKHGLSNYLFKAKIGDHLTIEGPFGTNILRECGRPLLVLAGGIGIAPMKSIIEARLQSSEMQPVTLYWGVRDRNQLYLDGFFQTLVKTYSHFRYHPIVQTERGLMGHILIEDFQSFSGLSIYLAGPRGMIDSLLPLLRSRGAQTDHLFSDAFSF